MGNCEISTGVAPVEVGIDGASRTRALARQQEKGEAVLPNARDELVPVLPSASQLRSGDRFVADRLDDDESEDEAECERRGHDVWLHVYDLESVTARLNSSLKHMNLGAFHCGVEVLEDEWFFAWGDSAQTGVVWNFPKGHQVHIYRESVYMGETPLSAAGINEVLYDVMEAWPANTYHPITRNCVTFAEELLVALKVPEPFPTWVRGAVDVGKSPAVLPIANMGWRWVEWWCKKKAEEENAEDEALEAAQLAAELNSQKHTASEASPVHNGGVVHAAEAGLSGTSTIDASSSAQATATEGSTGLDHRNAAKSVDEY